MTRIRPLDVAAIGTLLTALVAGLVVPPDAVQGDFARILNVHVPSAWIAYLSFAVTSVASLVYLVRRSLRWDRIAASSAEVGVVFIGLALATGMIWGKPVWGVWWTWEARSVLTAVMFFIYLGYLALRRAIDDPHPRAIRSAVLGVVAVVQIPIVHFSVIWWRSLHQPPTVLRPGDPQMDPPLLFALFMAVAAFTVVYAALLRRRIDLAKAEDLRAGVPLDDERVAGAGVVPPALGGADV